MSFCFSRPSPVFQSICLRHFGCCLPSAGCWGYSLLLWTHSPALLCSAFPSWASVPKSPHPPEALTWLLSLPQAWPGTWGMEVVTPSPLSSCCCPVRVPHSHSSTVSMSFRLLHWWCGGVCRTVGEEVKQQWDDLREFQLKTASFGGSCSAEWHWRVVNSPCISFVLCWS